MSLIQMPKAEYRECLVRRVAEESEAGERFTLPMEVDLTSALSLIGNLQLALRHPGNNGASAMVARQVVRGLTQMMRANGYPAHAELAELGNDPEWDE